MAMAIARSLPTRASQPWETRSRGSAGGRMMTMKFLRCANTNARKGVINQPNPTIRAS